MDYRAFRNPIRVNNDEIRWYRALASRHTVLWSRDIRTNMAHNHTNRVPIDCSRFLINIVNLIKLRFGTIMIVRDM